MRSFVVALMIATLCLCMVTAPAFAGGPKSGCKQIFARFQPSEYFAAPHCEFNGVSYENCLRSRFKGTLDGFFYFYFPNGNTVTEADPMAGHPGYMTGFGIGRVVTKKGEIWSRDAWIIDLERTDGFTAFSQVSFITGGTKVYEGASGDIFQFGSDIDGGNVRGEVCKLKK